MTTSVSGSVLQAVRAMKPVLDEHRSWADEHACMAPAVLAAARDAGIFTLLAPREVGGAEASLPEALVVCAELAAGDATVYWHAGNSAALGLAAAYLQPEDRAAVFAGPPGPYGFSVVRGGTATPVDGGYRLTGRWPFLTGARDVTWAAVNGVVHDSTGPRLVDGMPDVRLFIVPAADFQVEDTWGRASAMRGTGSHAVTVDGALVPEGLAHAWTKPKLLDRPLYRLPSAFAGPVTNAAATIGILRRAVDEAIVLIAGKVSRADGIAYRDKARIQRGVARASSTVDMLEGGLRDMATDVWTCAETGRVPAAARSRMWPAAFFALDQARRALSELVTVSTSAVYADRNPIETALRDIHAISAAMESFRDYEEAAGRVLLGSIPDSPGF